MLQASRKPWFLLLAAILFAAALPVLLELVNQLGHQIPVLDRGNDYLKGVILAALLAGGLIAAPVSKVDRRNLLILWAVKSAVSLGVMLLYEWNYSLDAYWYFSRSQEWFPRFEGLGFGRGTENLAATLWYLEHSVISLGSYHSQKVLCSFTGLLAVFLFYRGLAARVENLAPRTLFYLGLFPSVLFWSSILGKDPINLFGTALFFYGAFSFFKGYNPVYLLPAVCGLLVTALIRTWIVPMLLLPFAIGFVAEIRQRWIRIACALLILAGLIVGIQKMAGELMLESQETLAEVNKVSRAWQRGGSSGYIPELNSYSAMIKFLPIGMFTALFRPLPGEVLNPFGLLAGLENLVVLLMLGMALRHPARQAWANPVVLTLVSYILIWSMAYAFISPQNLGAAVRFRLQVFPMMVFVLLFIPKALKQRVILNPRERRNNTGNT